MNKLLILDKDGTLVKPVSGGTFPQHPEDQELLPGVTEAIKYFADDGWMMAIASNQGGVAAGYKSLEDAIAEMQYCLTLLPQHIAFRAYFCPDFEGQICYGGDFRGFERMDWQFPSLNYRKPNIGMITLAIKEVHPHQDHVQPVLLVGDLDTDRECAKNANISFMWANDWVKLT